MYAAANSGLGSEEIVQELLRAGADPQYQSPYGDTVLMAAAIARNFDEDLAKTCGNINVQNRDGATVLMLLATRGDPEPIEEAIRAGAKTSLRDRKGRRAVDYLKANNCGRNLIRGYTEFLTTPGPRPLVR